MKTYVPPRCCWGCRSVLLQLLDTLIPFFGSNMLFFYHSFSVLVILRPGKIIIVAVKEATIYLPVGLQVAESAVGIVPGSAEAFHVVA